VNVDVAVNVEVTVGVAVGVGVPVGVMAGVSDGNTVRVAVGLGAAAPQPDIHKRDMAAKSQSGNSRTAIAGASLVLQDISNASIYLFRVFVSACG
jgi:hypothetical protein